MKFVFTLFLLFGIIGVSNSQNKYKSETFGGDNSLLVINDYFNPFAYNFFRMLNYRIECFGTWGDVTHYSFQREGLYGTFGISDELDIVYVEEVNIPTKYTEPVFVGSIRLNEYVHFFVDVKSDEFSSGIRALYSVTLDLEMREFAEPQFIATFYSKTKLKANLLKSPDEKRLGLTIISDSKKGLDYSYDLVTFDEETKPLIVEKNINGEFETPHFYSSSFINNSGQITVVYTENGDKISGSGFEKSHLDAILFTHDGTTPSKKIVELTDRKILDIQPVTTSQGEQLFVSWMYEMQTNRTGFSLVNKTNLEEQLITEFNADWVEPFVELDLNDFVDRTFCNNPKDQIPVHYQLLEIVEGEQTITYVLEKNTKTEFFAADQGATIVTIKNTNTSTTVNGDVIIVQTDLAGTLIDTAKIERYLIHGINSGHVQTFVTENKCDLIYTNTLNNISTNALYGILPTSDLTKSQYKGKPENYQFLVSEINLESTGLKLLTYPINHFRLESKATQFVPYTETCTGAAKDFTVVAFVEDGLQIIRLLY